MDHWVKGMQGLEAWRAFSSRQKDIETWHRMAHGNLGLTCTYFPVWASGWDGLSTVGMLGLAAPPKKENK